MATQTHRHTHTHTHARTYTYKDAHTDTDTHTQLHTHAHTHVDPPPHPHTDTHTHTHTSGATDLGVLLHQLGEVVEETVLGTQEVEEVVALLSLHHCCQKLTPVASHKLGSQLYNIPVDRMRMISILLLLLQCSTSD